MYLSLKNKLRKYKLAKYSYDKILKLKHYAIRISKDKYKSRKNRVLKYEKIIINATNKFPNYTREKIVRKVLNNIKKIKNSDILYNNLWWFSFIDIMISTKSNKSVMLNNFLLITKNNNSISNLRCSVALEMYYLCLQFGLYESALVFYDQACDAAIKEVSEDPQNIYYQLRGLVVHFIRANKKYLTTCLEKISIINSSDKRIEPLIYFLGHTCGFSSHNIKESFNRSELLDENYLSLVKGSSVAVVSRAAYNTERGGEIDDFDLVVRTNYRGADLIPRSKFEGKRIDISYYNGDISTKILDEDKGKLPHNLKAAVFKLPLDHLYDGSICKRSMTLFMHLLTFESSTMSLPNIISDLLMYEPSRIKIFSADSMLSRKRPTHYAQNPLNKVSAESPNYPRTHDIISDYLIMSKLLSNGLIEGDPHFTRAIDLGKKTYMSELQSVWIDTALSSKNFSNLISG